MDAKFTTQFREAMLRSHREDETIIGHKSYVSAWNMILKSCHRHGSEPFQIALERFVGATEMHDMLKNSILQYSFAELESRVRINGKFHLQENVVHDFVGRISCGWNNRSFAPTRLQTMTQVGETRHNIVCVETLHKWVTELAAVGPEEHLFSLNDFRDTYTKACAHKASRLPPDVLKAIRVLRAYFPMTGCEPENLLFTLLVEEGLHHTWLDLFHLGVFYRASTQTDVYMHQLFREMKIP